MDDDTKEKTKREIGLRKVSDGTKLLKFKRNVSGTKKDGTKYGLEPPKVVDASKQPMTGLVGNGSLVNIAYDLNQWNVAGNSGTSARLSAVQVLELVEYSGGGAGTSEFEDEGETNVIADTFESDSDSDDIF